MKKSIAIVLLFAVACAVTGYAQPQELSLTSGAIHIRWVQGPDGWKINRIEAGNKMLSQPSGYYTLIYNAVRPHGGRIEPNVEGKGISFFPSKAEQLADGSLLFTHELRVARVEAIWKIDPQYPTDIQVTMNTTIKVPGYFSVSTPSIAIVDTSDLAWGMVPGNWYGTFVELNSELSTKYSMGLPATPMITREKTTMSLCPLLSTRNGISFATIPEPGTGADPWEKDTSSREVSTVALAVLNRHNQLSPVAYAPVLGGRGSERKEGETMSFRFRYSVQAADWYSVFRHVVENIYRFPELLNIQQQKVSLSERLSRLQVYLHDDVASKWNTRKEQGVEIGANGSKNADIGALLMLAYANGDTVMQRRLPYVRNYKLTQQRMDTGFFQYAATGEYISKDGYVSEIGNWIEPMYTTFYTLMDMGNMLLFNSGDNTLRERVRLAADKLMSWQHADGGWDVAYDQYTHQLAFPHLKDFRATWYGLLVAYRVLGDKKYLEAAEKGAAWQVINGVNKGLYLGVCGDARNIWDFATAQTAQALLDLYEVTGKPVYKNAAIEAAKVYTTSIFTHPMPTTERKKAGDRMLYDWELSQVGLGVEHIRGTAAGAGPILISSFTGLFMRMHELTGDSLFLTMARGAARGRHAFMEEKTGQTIYYWMDLDKVAKRVAATPHHAYWQIGWITDYLLSEAHFRSGGHVVFPQGFMTPKVGPHKTYGFAAGNIFGQKAHLHLPPGLLKSDNPYYECLSALSDDRRTLYVIVMSQATTSQQGTVDIDLSRLDNGKQFRWKKEKALLGAVHGKDRKNSRLQLQLPAWGIHVIAIDLAVK